MIEVVTGLASSESGEELRRSTASRSGFLGLMGCKIKVLNLMNQPASLLIGISPRYVSRQVQIPVRQLRENGADQV